MSDFIPRLPARPSLEQLQKQARDLLRQHRAGDPEATARFSIAKPGGATLAGAQFVVARQHGFETWARLKHYLEAPSATISEQYERLADDLVSAFGGDESALDRLHKVFGNAFVQGGRALTADLLRGKVRAWLSVLAEPVCSGLGTELTRDGARLFLARQHGFENWAGLLESVAQVAGPPAVRDVSNSPRYQIDWRRNTLEAGPVLSERDWDGIIAVMKAHGITSLNAAGRMTDAALRRVTKLDRLTRLNLDGCIHLTDDGLAQLARLPRLRELDLGGRNGAITDKGLAVLRQLPELRRFQLGWQQNVSDAGIANLAFCERLENVDLLGTPAGDGAIAALAGKSGLSRLKTGRAVTDAGLALLRDFPEFRTWQGGDPSDGPPYELMRADAGSNHLLIDGPFTDAGLGRLSDLDGLAGLTFFWHCPAFTAAGLEALAGLPHLGFLGCQGEHCDDEAMRHIAALPGLRMLMGQGAVAGDDGFTALSRSETLEYLWGRECPNLTGRGFAAMATMPSLRGLAVSCRNVDDAALSALPRFPALREFLPMDVPDEGFRHVGQCEKLEALWCMYCRETGDLATEHIARLSRLKSYYAGSTRIADRSLEILGRMHSLERLEFRECRGITNAGVGHVARLPSLREIALAGLPGVTREALALFGAQVRVSYSP